MSRVWVLINTWEPYPGSMEMQEIVSVHETEEKAEDARARKPASNDSYHIEAWNVD